MRLKYIPFTFKMTPRCNSAWKQSCFIALFRHLPPCIMLCQVWKRLQGEIKQYYLRMSLPGVQGKTSRYCPHRLDVSSYGFTLDEHMKPLLSLVSLPFLHISLMPTPKFSPMLGSWCHPGLPGKVEALGMMFLASR